MKNLIGVVLLLVGVGIGFGIGRIGNGDAAVQEPVAQGKDKALLEAERRIASLEKELAAAKKPRSVKTAVAKKAEKTDDSSTNSVEIALGPDGDIESELKKHLTDDQFAAATNAMARLRANLQEREKGRKAYLESVDLSNVSAAERKNHEKFMALLAKKEEVMSKMKGSFPDAETLQELAMIQMQMGSLAKKERSMLARELGREMGYSGEDLEIVHDAVENIYDCTSPGGLQDAFGAGDDDSDVNVSTQVISL